jgi:hypothetical protein
MEKAVQWRAIEFVVFAKHYYGYQIKNNLISETRRTHVGKQKISYKFIIWTPEENKIFRKTHL